MVMNLQILYGKGEFSIKKELNLCQEIICSEKDESKRWDVTCLSSQIFGDRDSHTFIQIVDSRGLVLENHMIT